MLAFLAAEAEEPVQMKHLMQAARAEYIKLDRPLTESEIRGLGMKPKNIELNIDELVLHGFSPSDRFSIGEVVERKLTRLLADRGVPQSLERGGEVVNVDGGAFEVAPDSRAQVVGAQVAKAVYGGLRQ